MGGNLSDGNSMLNEWDRAGVADVEGGWRAACVNTSLQMMIFVFNGLAMLHEEVGERMGDTWNASWLKQVGYLTINLCTLQVTH